MKPSDWEPGLLRLHQSCERRSMRKTVRLEVVVQVRVGVEMEHIKSAATARYPPRHCCDGGKADAVVAAEQQWPAPRLRNRGNRGFNRAGVGRGLLSSGRATVTDCPSEWGAFPLWALWAPYLRFERSDPRKLRSGRSALLHEPAHACPLFHYYWWYVERVLDVGVAPVDPHSVKLGPAVELGGAVPVVTFESLPNRRRARGCPEGLRTRTVCVCTARAGTTCASPVH